MLSHFSRVLLFATFPGTNTGVGCRFLLQGIFLTQGSNPGLLCLSPKGSAEGQGWRCTGWGHRFYTVPFKLVKTLGDQLQTTMNKANMEMRKQMQSMSSINIKRKRLKQDF